jgi:Gas vesicle protein
MTTGYSGEGVPDAYARADLRPRGGQPQQLADVLERVLDKGIVIVGDIQVRLLDIELLTIKVRLLVASVDRAREMGINWWEGDAFVSSLEDDEKKAQGSREAIELQRRVAALEERVGPAGVEAESTEERPAEEQNERHGDRR